MLADTWWHWGWERGAYRPKHFWKSQQAATCSCKSQQKPEYFHIAAGGVVRGCTKGWFGCRQGLQCFWSVADSFWRWVQHIRVSTCAYTSNNPRPSGHKASSMCPCGWRGRQSRLGSLSVHPPHAPKQLVEFINPVASNFATSSQEIAAGDWFA